MSAFVTVWNANSWPVQVSEDGLLAPGLSESQIDLTDSYGARALELGHVVLLDGAVVAPPANEQMPDSQTGNIESDGETSDEVLSADDSEAAADDDAKPTKSPRKSQANKES